jgi:hypothetical protein
VNGVKNGERSNWRKETINLFDNKNMKNTLTEFVCDDSAKFGGRGV